MCAEYKTTQLNYTLTMSQKLLNPPETLAFRIAGVLGTSAIVHAIALFPSYWPFWLLLCLVLLVFGRFLWSGVRLVLERNSQRHLTVHVDAVGIGRTEPEYWISRRPLRVERGLCGTHLIRNPFGLTLIVSARVISLAELKKVVEMDRCAM